MKNKATRYRRYRKPKRNYKLIILVTVAVVFVIIAAIVLLMTLKPWGQTSGANVSSGITSDVSESSSTISQNTASQNSQPVQSSSSGQEQNTAGTSDGTTSSTQLEPVTEYQEYVSGKPVPQSPPVDSNYFKDAVFVGDSRTEGLMLYTGLSAYTTAYADKGLTVSKVFSEPLVKQGDKTVTVDEALRTAQYNKCYIMLGINELGWPNENVFISHYEDIINAVKESHPDAKIYVQSILPVSASKSEKNQNGINNERINKYNQLLLELSEKTGAYYLDTAASVKGEDGTLPESATSDGIHLNKQFCTQWLDYLKNHTVQ